MFDFPASPASGQIYQPAGGPVWQFDGTAWKTMVSAQGVRGPTKTIFTTVGTSPYIIPSGCTAYEVEVLGGGGGGGNTAGASAAGTAAAGSGGAAGAYCKKLIQVTDAIRAATKTIVVGAGGAGNTNGGASSYTDGVNTLASGVASSGAQGAWSSNVTHLLGGGGSLANGGDINSAGANGEASQTMGSTNCGASSAAMRPGKGGDTIYGNGGRGYALGAQSGAATQNGLNALGYGAGGGGGGAINGAGANGIGGNGAPGIVVITEFYGGDSNVNRALPVIGWRFDFVSTTQCRLRPYNGDSIRINGSVYPIPVAGVTLANTACTASTLMYVYAYVSSSGAVALEVSTTGHSTDTTTGNVGTEIKTGDPTRSLVGIVRTVAANTFQMGGAGGIVYYGVRSWMNRGALGMFSATAGTSVGLPGGMAEATTAMRIFFVSWANEVLIWNASMTFYSTALVTVSQSLVIDGANWSYVQAYNIDNSGRVVPFNMHHSNLLSATDGYHTATIYHQGSPAGGNLYSGSYHSMTLLEGSF